MIISRGTSYRKARVDSQKRGLCFSDFNTKQKRNSSKAYLSAKYLQKADVLILNSSKEIHLHQELKGWRKDIMWNLVAILELWTLFLMMESNVLVAICTEQVWRYKQSIQSSNLWITTCPILYWVRSIVNRKIMIESICSISMLRSG